METFLRKAQKFIPRKLYRAGQPAYHYLLALTGALIYRFPSRRINVIFITGTKGKSSTVEFINAILEAAGYKTALAGTIRFKIGEKTARPLEMYLADIYTVPANIAGVPAISIPCGTIEEDGKNLRPRRRHPPRHGGRTMDLL